MKGRSCPTACPSACFISETTERISLKYIIRGQCLANLIFCLISFQCNRYETENDLIDFLKRGSLYEQVTDPEYKI
jgi:hypothetical protein